jgi:hypothetical protein
MDFLDPRQKSNGATIGENGDKMKRLLTIFVLGIILTAASISSAATKIWTGTDDTNWAGPNNWSPVGVPGNSDNVYFQNSSIDVALGLDQNAVTLASLNIEQTYTGEIGTTTTYLRIKATAVEIGYNYGPVPSQTGSPRIKLDLSNAQSYVTIHNSSASPTETTMPPIRLKFVHASTVIEVRKGKVGIAYETGETSTLATVVASYVSSKMTDADVFIGAGTTLTTLTQTGGDVILLCAATTVNAGGGTLLVSGTGAITTLNATGGTITSNSTGTITTCNISGGIVDFTKSTSARTVTTMKLDAGGQLKFDPDTITITNKITSNDPATYTATAI